MDLTPDLSHYVGQRIEAIESFPDADTDEPTWSVTLSSGVVLFNLDPEMPAPSKDLVGLGIALLTLQTGVTTLFLRSLNQNFTQDDNRAILFNPKWYAIVDPRYGETAIRPQLSEVDPGFYLPPEPTERLADGPEEDEE